MSQESTVSRSDLDTAARFSAPPSTARLRPQLAENDFERTPSGEARLQQVRSDERREREPPRADEDRTFGYTQRERHEKHRSRERANDLPGGHAAAPSGDGAIAAGLRRYARR